MRLWAHVDWPGAAARDFLQLVLFPVLRFLLLLLLLLLLLQLLQLLLQGLHDDDEDDDDDYYYYYDFDLDFGF